MGVQLAQLMGDIAERLANGVELIAEAQAGSIQKIEDWYSINRIIKSGMGRQFFPIGDQILDTWEKASGTEYQAPWDVVNHYENGDMALNWHFAIPDGIPYDQPEAIYYAPAAGLPAGQYYITIDYNYGTGWVAGKHINFTLQNAMEAGDQLVLTTATNNANDPTNGMAWNVYAKGGTESKENGVTSESTEGTELGSTSASGVGYTNGQINAPQRVVYGYNRWSQSAIRQWLNSVAAAGSWWAPQNGWDRPPSVASTLRGFLAGYGEDFLSILKPYPVVTALNTVEGAQETTETTYDKIFLPSLQEMYINTQLANVEGEDWEYYVELAREIGLTGRFGTHPNTYEVLKKYNISSQSSAVYVWLRSCVRGYAYYDWNITSTGIVNYSNANYAFRGCPACIIQKSE